MLLGEFPRRIEDFAWRRVRFKAQWSESHHTSVAQRKMPPFDQIRFIMLQTGHRDVATLRRYIRTGKIFRQNAASKLGI